MSAKSSLTCVPDAALFQISGNLRAMGSERITVTLPPELVANARIAVRSGAAESLSAFVADALRGQLERNQALIELERVLGGRPPREALEAVRRDLGLPPVDQRVA
jgi:antitoxin ParD1/3/4